jgi:pimeloyl-ACP methyl ester carboxylesterase
MKRVFIAFILVCLSTAAAQTQENNAGKVEAGQINGAAFRIEVPANWNKGLVMHCHGYQLAGMQPNLDSPRQKAWRDVFISRGFALAESAYLAQGWAVKEAIEDTEALRRHFVSKYGKPSETYVTGFSMGAVITLATIEKYPEIYDGAMPMCGPLNAILNGLQERLFDMLVTFDYLFTDTVGSLVRLPKGSKLDVVKVKAAVAAAPEKAAMFARRYSLATVEEISNVLSFFYEINRELQERAGGNPFDNRNTIYDGFGDDVALNRGVKRYAADARAREYLRQYYTPSGRISDPVLTLHTTYDQLVPGRYVSEYDNFARLAGTQDLFVAKFVVANGHCNFTPAQTGAAFDELLNWARNHKRPEAGEIKQTGSN